MVRVGAGPEENGSYRERGRSCYSKYLFYFALEIFFGVN